MLILLTNILPVGLLLPISVTLLIMCWNIRFQIYHYTLLYEVERLLRLQKNTSPGCDLLPSWLMRSCLFELASLVAHIYNCSIHSGIVPISWHTAILTPVPKVSAPASLNDYRPISVTPILSRIAEKFIVKHFIRPAIPRYAVLDQFAFKPSGSTTCALVGLQHHVIIF